MTSGVLSIHAVNTEWAGDQADSAKPDAVARAIAGETDAFGALYKEHVEHIFGLCLKMCRNRQEAEEATQDAFVQAWRKLHLFRGESAFGTWLHRVAVNTVLGRMRKAKLERARLEYLGDEHPDTALPDGTPGTGDVEAALKLLPDGARSVVVLCAIYGYTHAETGAMLGIATGTCKAQLHRARRLLAANLA